MGVDESEIPKGNIKKRSDMDIFKDYSNRFKNKEYASAYHKELTVNSSDGIPLRRRLIGSIVAYFEKRAVSRLLKYTKGSSIIDIPCGSGKLNPILKATNCNIISADASPQMIEFAKGDRSADFEFMLSDIRFIPLKSESVDILISNRFLHRIPAENHGIVLKELFRISRRYVILYFGSKTLFTSLIITLEELFNIGNRGEIYYLEHEDILEEIKRNNWFFVKKVKVLPLISTGTVYLVEKRNGQTENL
ncbi:MAG TPA: class I SAM-dependent methyltransferase [Fervidobacterium sp.]|nr:class I SAM-dependent methyltransferase [Fervidobacterium sp.]